MDTATPVILHGYSGDGQSLEEFAAACFPDQKPICIDLPGFGANPVKNKSAETDPREYLNETWDAVRRAVPEGKIHLVGHSYGGVLAFGLAAEHPDVVTQVDLFCPGVFPRFMPQLGLLAARLFRLVPGGLRLVTWVFQRPVFVDAVTHSMENKSWPEKRKQQIIAMRRKESLTYSPQMFQLSLHALSMPKLLISTHCSVPVRIVDTNDDTVTSHKSALWLKERSDNATITTTYGGHLAIVAEPERLAAILYGAEK